MLNELVVKIGADVKKALQGLEAVQQKVAETGQQFQEFGASLTTFATLPIGLAGGAMIKFSSDMEESLNKTRIAFGDSAKSVIKWSETSIKSMGLAQGSALDAAALFGDMGTSMGIAREEAAKMSMRLVQLGADMASFKNIPIEQAMNALAGVFTGETESLKLLGVVMLETNLNAFALSQGINKKVEKMTEAEKVALRYAYILDKTKNAQGDFARTSEGAANQMRMFQENLKELAAAFGEVILPAFTKVLKSINDFLVRMAELPTPIKATIIAVSGLVAVIGPLSMALGAFLILINPVITAVRSISVAMTAAGVSFASLVRAAPTAYAAILLIQEWTKAIQALTKEWDRFSAFFVHKWEKIKAITVGMGAIVKAELAETFGPALVKSLTGISAAEGIVNQLNTVLKDTEGYKRQQFAIANTMLTMAEYRYQTALVEADIKRINEAQNKNAGMTDYMTSQEIIRNEVTEKSLKLNSELIAKAKELKVVNDDLRKSQMDSVTKLGNSLENSLRQLYSKMEQMDIERVQKYEKLDIQKHKDVQKRADEAFRKQLKAEEKNFNDRMNAEKLRNAQALAGIDSVLGAEIKKQQEKIKAIEVATEAEEIAMSDAQRLSEIANKRDLLQNSNANKAKEIEAARLAVNLERIELEAEQKAERDKEETNRTRLVQEAQANRELEKARMIHNYNQKLQAADGQEEANKVVADFEYARLQDQIDFENKIAKINENSKLKQLDIDTSYQDRVKSLDEKLAKEQIQISESFAKQNEQVNAALIKDEAEHNRTLLLRQRKADVQAAQQEIERISDLAQLAKENEQKQTDQKQNEIQTAYNAETDRIKELQSLVNEGYAEQLRKLEEFHNKKLERFRENYQKLNAEEAIQETVRRGLIEKDQNSIIELLKTFDPKWQDAGRSYGEQLIEGLNSKKQSIQSAVNSILSMIPSNLTVPTAPNAKTPKTPAPSTFAEMVSGIKNEYQPVFNLYANDRVLASSAGSGMNDILRSKVNTNR
jgi:hypothetical protein